MRRNLMILAALVVAMMMMIGCVGTSPRVRNGAVLGATVGTGAVAWRQPAGDGLGLGSGFRLGLGFRLG